MRSPETVLGELSEGTIVKQDFFSPMDSIDKFTFYITTFARENTGLLTIKLIDSDNGTVLSQLLADASLLENESLYEWELEVPISNALNKQYTLLIESSCPAGKAPSIYGYYVEDKNSFITANGTSYNISICFSFSGENDTWIGKNYWNVFGVLTLVIFLYMIWVYVCHKQNKHTIALHIAYLWDRYKFLIQQLVVRDFKTKYKRSMLGYLWSFLNPLLTMTVQYIVFSTIFKSDIKNFPVYLLSGIIMFGFFTDSVGQGLGAIVVNASLITKVYVPKYIYPVTKVVSSAINLIISIIPLLIVCLLTKAPFTEVLLLLPFVIICLIVFCIGISLMLSSAMVFFRDTQYLWGIISLAWMYATPLFYPETIIPQEYRFIQTMNPLYYIIKFARIILIEGVSPEPVLYLYCMFSSIAALFIGAIIFKETQDKFVLYI